jgi:hypothetical protein
LVWGRTRACARTRRCLTPLPRSPPCHLKTPLAPSLFEYSRYFPLRGSWQAYMRIWIAIFRVLLVSLVSTHTQAFSRFCTRPLLLCKCPISNPSSPTPPPLPNTHQHRCWTLAPTRCPPTGHRGTRTRALNNNNKGYLSHSITAIGLALSRAVLCNPTQTLLPTFVQKRCHHRRD